MGGSERANPLYVGIDVGTTGVRAVAVDGRLSPIAHAQAELPSPEGNGPERHQDPAVWWRGLASALDALLAQIPDSPVAALALDGTSATLLVADATGEPLAPALMYNDQSARAEAARVAGVAPPDSGAHGTSASLAKLLKLLAAHPQSRFALHQADWLSGRLTGHYGWADENNVLKLGYDPVRRQWPDWLADLGVPARLLPQVVAPGTALGVVAPWVARRFGLAPDTRVMAGTTDSVAAVIATGVHQVGEAVTSLGSTLVLKVISHRPVFAAAYGVYSHRLGERWLAGGASNAGGSVLRAYFSQPELDALTPQVDPEQPTGLDYYPLPRPGERFPVADPALAPRLTPQPEDRLSFFQGILEGLARIEHTGYQRLAELGAPYPASVCTVGGGAANEPWRRLRTRILGVPVSVAAHSEAGYGAAMLAAGRWAD